MKDFSALFQKLDTTTSTLAKVEALTEYIKRAEPAGVPIPPGLFDADLGRLSRAVQRTAARRLIVLGDLIHGRRGLTPEVGEKILRWRRENPLEFIVTAGNHDRGLANVAREWGATVCPELREGPFRFRHEAGETREGYTWSGHLHPTYVLTSRTQSLRFPCFHLSERKGILPAFSEFTRGVKVKKSPGDRIFLLAKDSIVEV